MRNAPQPALPGEAQLWRRGVAIALAIDAGLLARASRPRIPVRLGMRKELQAWVQKQKLEAL